MGPALMRLTMFEVRGGAGFQGWFTCDGDGSRSLA